MVTAKDGVDAGFESSPSPRQTSTGVLRRRRVGSEPALRRFESVPGSDTFHTRVAGGEVATRTAVNRLIAGSIPAPGAITTLGGVAHWQSNGVTATLSRTETAGNRRSTVICSGFESRRLHDSALSPNWTGTRFISERMGSNPAPGPHTIRRTEAVGFSPPRHGAWEGSSPARDGTPTQSLSATLTAPAPDWTGTRLLSETMRVRIPPGPPSPSDFLRRRSVEHLCSASCRAVIRRLPVAALRGLRGSNPRRLHPWPCSPTGRALAF